MIGHSKEFEETVKAGRFVGPLTKPDQDMFDLLTSFLLFEDSGLVEDEETA